MEDLEFLENMVKEYKQFGDLDNPDYEDTERIYKAIQNLIARYKETQLNDKEKEVVEAYRNLVKQSGKDTGWVVCDPKQMWSDYFVPKIKLLELREKLQKEYDCARKGFMKKQIPTSVVDGTIVQEIGWILQEIDKLLED